MCEAINFKNMPILQQISASKIDHSSIFIADNLVYLSLIVYVISLFRTFILVLKEQRQVLEKTPESNDDVDMKDIDTLNQKTRTYEELVSIHLATRLPKVLEHEALNAHHKARRIFYESLNPKNDFYIRTPIFAPFKFKDIQSRYSYYNTFNTFNLIRQAGNSAGIDYFKLNNK